MDKHFEERRIQLETIERYRQEIEKLLAEKPELAPLQRKIEDQLDKVGSVDSPEGRINRLALAFALMQESFVEFQQGLVDYQCGLADALGGEKKQVKKPTLSLVK